MKRKSVTGIMLAPLLTRARRKRALKEKLSVVLVVVFLLVVVGFGLILPTYSFGVQPFEEGKRDGLLGENEFSRGQAQLALLEISRVTVIPQQRVPGQMMISVAIKNIGSQDVSNLKAEFYKVARIDNGRVERHLGDRTHVGPLAAGDTAEISFATVREPEDVEVVVKVPDYSLTATRRIDLSSPPVRGSSGSVTVERIPGTEKENRTDLIADVLLVNPPFERWMLLSVPGAYGISVGPSKGSVDTVYGESEGHGQAETARLGVTVTTSWGYKQDFVIGSAEVSFALKAAYEEAQSTYEWEWESVAYHLNGDETNSEHGVVWHQEIYKVNDWRVYEDGVEQGEIVVADYDGKRTGVLPVSVYNELNGDHPDISEHHHKIGCVKSYEGEKILPGGYPVDTYWESTTQFDCGVTPMYVEWSYKEENGWENSATTTMEASLTLQSEIGGVKTESSISISRSTTHTVSGSEATEFSGYTCGVRDADLYGDFYFFYKPWVYWADISSGLIDCKILVIDYIVTEMGPGYDNPLPLPNVPFDQATTVRGLIIDTNASRNPVVGAQIDFKSDSTTYTTYTGSDGDYSISLPAGTYELIPAYSVQVCSYRWVFQPPPIIPPPEGYVTPGLKTGYLFDISGQRVTDTRISFIDVETGLVIEETVTDDNGWYSIDLPEGTYMITCSGASALGMHFLTLTGSETLLTSAYVIPPVPPETLAAFCKTIIGAKLAPLYGAPVKVAVVAEDLSWTDELYATFSNPTFWNVIMNLGPLGGVDVVYTARVDAVDPTWVPGVVADIDDSDARLVIHIFSGPVGRAFVVEWGTVKPKATLAGINAVGQMVPLHWDATGGLAETETLFHLGSGTVVQWQAGRLEVVWPPDHPNSRLWAIPSWMYPYPTDVNCDGKIDISDIAIVSYAIGSAPGDLRWQFVADVDSTGASHWYIDGDDLTPVAFDYGQTIPIPLEDP